jgi:hypothetical protein
VPRGWLLRACVFRQPAMVDYREFRRLREGGISNLPPAPDDVLDAASVRICERLSSSAMFAGVTVERTLDPERLLVASAYFRPGEPVAKVRSYLEAIWVSELRLPGLDAFSFHTNVGHVEFESFTGDKSSGYYLTLHVLAEEDQAGDFEERQRAEDAAGQSKRGGRDSARGGLKGWFRR